MSELDLLPGAHREDLCAAVTQRLHVLLWGPATALMARNMIKSFEQTGEYIIGSAAGAGGLDEFDQLF